MLKDYGHNSNMKQHNAKYKLLKEGSKGAAFHY